MQVEFAPRSSVAAWLRKGWRLAEGHDYSPIEWAIVMVLEDGPAPLTEQEIDHIDKRFNPPARVVPGKANTERASWIALHPDRERILCAIPDCARFAQSRGWCNLHYKRWARHGNPLTLVQPHVSVARQANYALRCGAAV